ncbi:hypothetical protein PV10_04984 [Exophiala mesophila]|uniref:Elongator complex protein 4 n=1 Tax=Exophiala mesophila TaxID=212818 RepID=A0A0D1WWM4_EXOME|nr:uncharacterized protein PV10_04984 [Exophiala mesophila]KIV93795.1 hypothetical protein PV10_04984 [Exophiala mesophila]
MSFRRRNVGLTGSTRPDGSSTAQVQAKENIVLPGVRPSPTDGRLTTSTGTSSLDGLLAGHSGLVLGSSLLVEESGTTDYAGALLRFYAAEGLVQGHHVHVIGLPEHWGRELPGVVGDLEKKDQPASRGEKMKIAWRYESLGQFGAGPSARERSKPSSPQEGDANAASQSIPISFCHTFDLTKRLVHPSSAKIEFLPLGINPSQSPFSAILERLKGSLANSSPDSVHRIVVPSLLSPAIYPSHASQPQNILEFLHSLRALYATYTNRVTAVFSLPVSLYPRSSGLVRWIELLNDGVLELSPFPHSAEGDRATRGPDGATEDPPQGLLQIHRLPVLHERGSGARTSETDWTFTLSRRKFVIKPFNLPPVEGDTDAQQAEGPSSKNSKADLEF